MQNKADLLRHCIAYALRDLRIQGRKGILTEADRYAIAEHVVARLREQRAQWNLDEALPQFFHGPSWTK